MAGIISDAQKKPDDSMVITGLDNKPVTISESDLEGMSHSDLYQLRDKNLNNKSAQTMLAPYEHQAFAREATKENPLMAIPIALATPLYAAAKSVGTMTDSTTTAPSLKQVGMGLKGVGQGLFASLLSSIKD